MAVRPQEGLGGVDFGTVRVSDAEEKKMTIRNTGKYMIAYSFSNKAGSKSEIVTLVPDAGNVEPGKEATVLVGLKSLMFGFMKGPF